MRVLVPLSIACLCLVAQDQKPLREEARDLVNLEGVRKEIDKGDTSSVEFLCQNRPLDFLEQCLEHYKQNVRGYDCTFRKIERIKGIQRPLEKIEVHFREEPFSVYFDWKEGAGLACKVLYVRGENNNKLLGLPILKFIGIKERDVDGTEAKSTGRYTIDQFGIYLGAQRTLASMRKADHHGGLHLEYKGLVPVPQLGDRKCHTFVRKPYDPVEEEGVNELTIFIDPENKMQVGSILKDVEGRLIAEYFFIDIKLNPDYTNSQFQRSALN
ncbi:MAG: DUF1571 domain-containing protein [Planctomycetes bacterium]|nr:DUF1571 domain-containing protein [Planctomycetota bacterium]